MRLENFGKNIEVCPAIYASPRSESDLIALLNENRHRKIRCIGRLHSWSRLLESNDVVVNMEHFNAVVIEQRGSETIVRVGAGCQLKDLVNELQKYGLTLPTLGLIDEQSVAGAIATGTHGSGRQSLSHFVQAVRIASYSNDDESAVVSWIGQDQFQRLRAARCSLGCLGIVTEIQFPARKQYQIEEYLRQYDTLNEVLEQESAYPLQQFFLIPWRWDYFAQHRRETDASRSWHTGLYRLFWSLGMDVAFHWIICLLARALPSKATPFAFRHGIPHLIPQGWKVVDRSDRQLTMQHEKFRHIEVELFVRKRDLAAAIAIACELLLEFAAKTPSEQYMHHYPICIRRVLPDDTLISPASGDDEPWYTLSFISYSRPPQRASFDAFATKLTQVLIEQFQARPHWGKYCVIDAKSIEEIYPHWGQFQACVPTTGTGYPFANDWLTELMQPIATGD